MIRYSSNSSSSSSTNPLLLSHNFETNPSNFIPIPTAMPAPPASISIDVVKLARAMDERRKALPQRNNEFTIARVPAYVRERNKKLYEPMTIAIGPYHHGRKHLQAMEEHKWQYLRDLFNRHPETAPQAKLKECLSKMKALEEKARSCYSESINLTSEEFVEIMLLDGCFIIESFRKHQDGVPQRSSMGWGLKLMDMDMYLLENQIPYFIIKALFVLIVEPVHEGGKRQQELLDSMYERMMRCKNRPGRPENIHHLLNLYHHWYVPTEQPRMMVKPHPLLDRSISLVFRKFTHGKHPFKNNRIPCVTELWEAGVSFRKRKKPRHKFDITFWNGIMKIPCIDIEDSTKPILTNLIAFEQSIQKDQRTITSFSWLMDSLINTDQDVAILQRNGIINNMLGSEAEVALFFNQLSEYTLREDKHYFAELFEQVNCYYNTKWHRYRAKLVHDYFGNPWAFISLVAASVLLFLTFMQTFFGIFAYFVPPSNDTSNGTPS